MNDHQTQLMAEASDKLLAEGYNPIQFRLEFYDAVFLLRRKNTDACQIYFWNDQTH